MQTPTSPTELDRTTPALRVDGAMLTNVGLVRSKNEDAVTFVVPPARGAAAGEDSLLLVADGMGGHAAGQVASALAAEIVRRVFFELTGTVRNLLSIAFRAANNAILDYGQAHPECAGMGTTCTVLAVRDGQAWLAHVGDSRAYLLRAATLRQLSEDQTLIRKLVRDGMMTEQEALVSDQNNVLLQALGTAPEINPELWSEGLQLEPDDILILCSDGLHGLVPDKTIAEIAARAEPLDACNELIQAALKAGGHDNVSVGVFRVIGVPGLGDDPGGSTTRRIPAAGNEFASQSTRQVSTFERPL
jgi:serine/threonine protein phosphatase PrpC